MTYDCFPFNVYDAYSHISSPLHGLDEHPVGVRVFTVRTLGTDRTNVDPNGE